MKTSYDIYMYFLDTAEDVLVTSIVDDDVVSIIHLSLRGSVEIL